MIKIHDLSFAYGEKQIFGGFSLEIPDGARSCIFGGSGCGKTTLLRLITGLEEPADGSIETGGVRFSAVFQEDRLCEEFSAVSNVRLVAHKSFSKADAENLLSLLGIDDFKKKVHDFSGGMKRRVAIARAIAADCDVILLDEAFKGLDADTRKNVIDVFRRYTEGKTIIAVTHDYEEAVLMNAGIVKL